MDNSSKEGNRKLCFDNDQLRYVGILIQIVQSGVTKRAKNGS